MFEVIYMKADFEPWWMFDGWEEEIISRHTFDNEVEANEYIQETLADFRQKFDNEKAEKGCFIAFWSKNENIYCEGCGEDLQIFHGLIVLSNGKPFSINN